MVDEVGVCCIECVGEGVHGWMLGGMFIFVVFFFFECDGDHRDIHVVDRRQRQMCIGDRGRARAAIRS